MLKVAMICMLIAVVVLAVGVSLMKKSSPLTFLLKTLALIALVCLGFVVANFKDDFSGFSILVILSALPMFLTSFDLKQLLEKEDKSQEAEMQLAPQETGKKNLLAQCKSNLLAGIGIFLSAVCLSIATLYIGKESFFGALLGVFIGGAVTLVFLALGKIKNPFDIIFTLLIYVSIGLMLSNIVLALLFSFSTANIMFCLGCLLFGVYAALSTMFNKNYLMTVYYASAILLVLSILL